MTVRLKYRKVLSVLLCTLFLVSALHAQQPFLDQNTNRLKGYLSHYYHGIRNTWDIKYQKPILIAGSVLIPISLLLDNQVQSYAQKHGFYSDNISRIGDLYGHRWGYYTTLAVIITTGIITDRSRQRTLSNTGLLVESILTTSAVTSITKTISHRQRPNGKGYRSYTSGHTSSAFALAAVIKYLYGKYPGCVAYGMAAFVASSRINDNKHYLSDVVSGALLGTLIGRAFTRQHSTELQYSIELNSACIQLGLHFPL